VTSLARPRSKFTVNYISVLSSERALQNNKPVTVQRKFQGERKNWSRVPDGCLTPRQTGRLTVGRKLTSTSTSTSYGTHASVMTGVRKSRIGIRNDDMLKAETATSASFLVTTPIIPFHLPFTSTPQCRRGSKNCVLGNEWK
jgi:hypothetical protein